MQRAGRRFLGMRQRHLFVFIAIAFVHSVWGIEYTVDPSGNDGHPGTREKPFQTIGKAIRVLQPGDVCRIQPGVYRESVALKRSGTKANPIRIEGAVDAKGNPLVVIDGTEPLTGSWDKVTVNGTDAWATSLNHQIVQLFHKGRMMTEARWPDQPFERIWDRTTWAKGDPGGYKGKMISSDITATGIDWTGALAVLNVGHQFKTWVRRIDQHSAGSNEFSYTLTERMGNGKEDGPTWGDDRFYLIGKLETLTSPGEWFYDDQRKRLLFIPPDGRKPAARDVTVKARDYGIRGSGLDHVVISGIKFFGCTFNFQDSNDLTIENCHVLYPNFSRLLNATLEPGDRGVDVLTEISGQRNLVDKLWIAYGNTSGIRMSGRSNILQNSIIHDICWNGNINYPGVHISGKTGEPCESRVSNCTIYNSGNVGILYRNRNNVIEYNHVYNTGLACKDIAAIHTGSPEAAGSVTHHNWVHDSMGKGIRGDDQTRSLTFHHNVIWNCDEGMILKGDFNHCYNNTVLGEDGHGCLIIPTRAEPQKWWAKHAFLDVQNANSTFRDNLVETIAYRHDPLPQNTNIANNKELADQLVLKKLIEQAQKRNFLPFGKVGAYVQGEPIWTAGADWQPPETGIELKINAEVARSWQLASSANKKQSIPLPRKLRESSLSAVSKKKLQALFDTCWSEKAVSARREAIQIRNKSEEDSTVYNVQDQIVRKLHQQANARLEERAGEALAGSELALFYEIVN
jgi:hypothetical protein